jgi:hypothetical protein
VVVYDGTAEKLTAKFTRTAYFGAFSWLISLMIGSSFNCISVFFNGPSFTQLFMSNLELSSTDAYAFLASAVLILLTTPVMCIIGAYLRRRSGVEYTERMRLHEKKS